MIGAHFGIAGKALARDGLEKGKEGGKIQREQKGRKWFRIFRKNPPMKTTL